MNNYTRIMSLAVLQLVLMVWLTGCAALTPTANPTGIAPMDPATTDRPVPATEAARTPAATLTVIETLVPEETVVEPMKPTPDDNPYIANLAQKARQDLAARLNISVDQIELLSFEDMVWPDGSLGCPQPGMLYTQVMVEGYRILLQHQGQVYAYHGGGSNSPFLCEDSGK